MGYFDVIIRSAPFSVNECHLSFLKQIAKILLHNAKVWRGVLDRGPIFVVCYTNHALDQFLEEIHRFHKHGIVRVGGRSQSEAMQECSLSKLKHKMREVMASYLLTVTHTCFSCGMTALSCSHYMYMSTYMEQRAKLKHKMREVMASYLLTVTHTCFSCGMTALSCSHYMYMSTYMEQRA